MSAHDGHDFALLDRLVGRELGPTAWHTITQADVDMFARVTGDHQWIHVDVQRASAESPAGGTIAHGFLTLSLISKFLFEVDLFPRTAKQVINYGLDRVRFVTPVRVGAKVRGRFQVLDVQDRQADGSKLVKCQATIEIDGAERPALVAVVLNLIVPHTATGESAE